MTTSVRRAMTGDIPSISRICLDAFTAIAGRHAFPPDIPTIEAATGIMTALVSNDRIYGIVAEQDGRIVGSNFLDERNPISGVGPITIDPAVQDTGIGRTLMEHVLARSAERGFAGTRLVQAAYHSRSLALYTKLGFEVRALLACIQGDLPGEATPGFAVRPASAGDVEACNALCEQVHGFARGGELSDAVAHSMARVVERGGRITGYCTPVAFFGHAVAETTDDLKALVAAADAIPGAGMLVPTDNAEFMRWCLARGLRITQTLSLMSRGLYSEPKGAWLPSIVY